MAFYGLIEDIFEILRVLAFCRPQKIWNWAKIDWATAQNVKVVKIGWGRFLKKMKNLIYWTAKPIFDNFYVLACSSANIGPILDFLVSPDS